MMTTILFVIANVKQLRIGGSFGILLPVLWTSLGVGVLNSAIFNSFLIRVEFGTILEGLRNFGGGGVLKTPTPPRYATDVLYQKMVDMPKHVVTFLLHGAESVLRC